MDVTNEISGFQIDGWSDEIQPYLMKSLVAREIADEKLSADLRQGDTVHYPKLVNMGGAVEYKPGNDIDISDYSAEDATLTVDQKYVVPHNVDDVNQLQMNYSARAELQRRSAYRLRDKIDKQVLEQATNAGQLIHSDGSGLAVSDFSGDFSDAQDATVTSGNIVKLFSLARKALRDKNVEEAGDFFAVITSGMAEILERTAADKGFKVADTTLRNGFAGDFMGFDVYISNNVHSGDSADAPIFGKKGAISLAVQQEPNVELKEEPRQLSSNILVWAVWGTKTFSEKADQFLTAAIAQ